MVSGNASQRASAELRLRELGIELPPPPTPFGAYVEAVQTGNLLFLSGMLPAVGHQPKFVGRLGKELDANAGREAVRIASLNVLSAARQNLGSLDKVTRVVRLCVYLATHGDFFDQPVVADAASELFRDVFGEEKTSVRMVLGVASLPLGVPAVVEVILEVEA
ncbi:MAG TPA: RidA family protein [Candidatus Acidoferrales bacterium]|nr:RidA family protein [Candidatus Acidoferrales bacterium]